MNIFPVKTSKKPSYPGCEKQKLLRETLRLFSRVSLTLTSCALFLLLSGSISADDTLSKKNQSLEPPCNGKKTVQTEIKPVPCKGKISINHQNEPQRPCRGELVPPPPPCKGDYVEPAQLVEPIPPCAGVAPLDPVDPGLIKNGVREVKLELFAENPMKFNGQLLELRGLLSKDKKVNSHGEGYYIYLDKYKNGKTEKYICPILITKEKLEKSHVRINGPVKITGRIITREITHNGAKFDDFVLETKSLTPGN